MAAANDSHLVLKMQTTAEFYCRDHVGEVLQRFCINCDRPVCIDCISENHAGHELRKFSAILDKKKDELAALINKTKQETMVDVERKLKTSQTLRQDFSKQTNVRVKEVQDRAEKMKQKIDEISSEIQDQLLKFQREYDEDFDTAETEMSTALSKLQNLVLSYEEALTVSDCTKIFEGCQVFCDEVENTLPNVYVPSEGPPSFHFHECESALKSLFGELLDESENYSDTVEFEESDQAQALSKREFTRKRNLPIRVRRDPARGRNRRKMNVNTGIRSPSRIKVSGWDTEITALVSVSPSESLALVDDQTAGGYICRVQRQKFRSEKIDVGSNVTDLALLDENRLAFTEKDQGKVFVHDIETDGCSILKDFSPGTVNGLCPLRNGEIACSVVDGTGFTPTNASRRAVVIISDEGTENSDLQYNGNSNEHLFTMPTKISELRNSNLCVLDRLSEENGRVVVISQSSKVQFTYEGLQGNQAFDPCDVTTHNSSIFIVERKFGLHEITENGQFARYILDQTSIWNPLSVVIDSESKAWIGCENGYILRMRIAQNTFSLVSVSDSEC